LRSELEISFSRKKFLCIVLALIAIILIDTSVVKIYEIIDKDFAPSQLKILLFSGEALFCLLLQFLLLKQVWNSFKTNQSHSRLQVRISLISLSVLGILIAIMIFQLYYFNQYSSFLTLAIIIISYGTAAGFIIWLSWMFLSWYRSTHKFIIFLYFMSMSLIAFNLIMTAALASAKVTDRPDQIGVYVGGGGDISGGRYIILDIIYRISSFTSFIGIWLTTAILMTYYREKLLNTITYWIIMLIPLAYFIITYFYQFILGSTLNSYLEFDPVTFSIVLVVFVSLSKPIGGLIFGIAFWNTARTVSYEKKVRTCMLISGWGVFLIFAANQGVTQQVTPFPPFGIPTITVLNIAAYLVLLGIYNSAKLVSVNNNLRKSIYKHAVESKILHLIGHAEMEKEIQKTVTKIIQSQENMEVEREIGIELDQKELRKYIDIVIKEVKKDDKPSVP
jgi:hypothetical protein